jgi:hypothetical protein
MHAVVPLLSPRRTRWHRYIRYKAAAMVPLLLPGRGVA